MSDNLNMKEYENKMILMAAFPYLVGSNVECRVSGQMGLSPIGSNTQFQHFGLIRIVAQCLDTWAWVQSVQIPDSDISAWLSLLHSVRTHWPGSNQYKYPIPTFLPDYNCCTVSGHIGPSPNDANTRIKHFIILRIVVQCLDTLARVHPVQILDSDISAQW